MRRRTLLKTLLAAGTAASGFRLPLVEAADYRGRVCDVKLDILFGHSGDLEIEFIEWRGGHSPHREFVEAGREGMHHLRYRVEDTDARIAKLAPLGYRPRW